MSPNLCWGLLRYIHSPEQMRSILAEKIWNPGQASHNFRISCVVQWNNENFFETMPSKLQWHPLQVACCQVAQVSQLPVAKLDCWSKLKNGSYQEFSNSHHPTLGCWISSFIVTYVGYFWPHFSNKVSPKPNMSFHPSGRSCSFHFSSAWSPLSMFRVSSGKI